MKALDGNECSYRETETRVTLGEEGLTSSHRHQEVTVIGLACGQL